MKKTALFSMVLLLGALAFAVPVHRYSFNGDASDSIGSADGTFINTTGNSSIADGKLKLTGNVYGAGGTRSGDPNSDPNYLPMGDFVDLPNGLLKEIAADNKFSVEMWVQWDADDTFGTAPLFAFGQTAGFDSLTPPIYNFGENIAPWKWSGDRETQSESDPNTYAIYALAGRPGDPGQTGQLFRWRNDPNGLFPGVGFQANTPRLPYEPNWVHYVVTYDYDKVNELLTVVVYNDGNIVASSTNGADGADISAWPEDFNNWIGRACWGEWYHFTGSVEEFRLYDYAMTAEQVSDSKLAGPDKVCDGRNQADLNGDCLVNGDDFELLYTSWLDQSDRKSVKDALIHRWEFNGDLDDSVGGKDGTLISEKSEQYAYGPTYFELKHDFGYESNNLLIPAEPTKGSFVHLPNDILTGHPNVTIEMFVTENDHRWDGQHFFFGANDQYWAKTGSWKKREAIGLSSQDSGCNPFFKLQSYWEEKPYESMQCWWHQGLGHWEQNIFVRPPLSYYTDTTPAVYTLGATHVAMTVENDVPGLWNWTPVPPRPTEPNDPNTDSIVAGDRITFYSDGQVAMGGSKTSPTPQIKIVPIHEGPNFQATYVWNDDNDANSLNGLVPDGYLAVGEAEGWKETANYIGRNGFKGGLPNAKYYDFRIYDRALTAEEIEDNFAGGSEDQFCNVPGDINNDCVVNLEDFATLAAEWFLSTQWP